MKFLKLALKNKERDAKSFDELYGYEVNRKIRQRYTVDQEFAIHRKRDSNPSEFAEYNAFVEHCKAEVKLEMNL